MRIYWPVLMVMVAATAAAERQPLSRYQSVIDRQMFGELPADFDPEKMPSEVAKSVGRAGAELTKEQEQLKSAIRFSSINITPDGATAVGFTDNSDAKTPHHYYLRVGEKRGPWELKEANAEEQTMTIAKDDIMVTLKLGGDSSKDTGATSRSGKGPSANRTALPSGTSADRGSSHNSPPGNILKNLRGGRRFGGWKQEFAEQMEKNKQALEAAEARRKEEDAEREAERAQLRSVIEGLRESIRSNREKQAEDKASESSAGQESQGSQEGQESQTDS